MATWAMGLWQYGHMGTWAFGHMGFMGMWAYGHMRLWTYGILVIAVPIEIPLYRGPGLMENPTYRSPNSGHMGAWAYGHKSIWAYGHMGLWPYGILYVGVPIEIPLHGRPNRESCI